MFNLDASEDQLTLRHFWLVKVGWMGKELEESTKILLISRHNTGQIPEPPYIEGTAHADRIP